MVRVGRTMALAGLSLCKPQTAEYEAGDEASPFYKTTNEHRVRFCIN